MNTGANVCDRCQYHIENDICGQCGRCNSSSYHQYCDMCCNVIYSGNVDSHNCREKETGTVSYVRSIEPDLRPRGVLFNGFICECDDILPLTKLNDHISTCDKLQALGPNNMTVKCYMCKCAMIPDNMRVHSCMISCHICHKLVKRNRLHKHRCIRQCASMREGINQYSHYGYPGAAPPTIQRTCKDCHERTTLFGHECKKAVNCVNKSALCLRCNADITMNWRDHECTLGETYLEVRCADCAQIRTTMMFRYHTCKQGPKAKCNQCDVTLNFNHILQHVCHEAKPAHEITVKCYYCENNFNYLKLHSHGESCYQRLAQVGQNTIAFCMTCSDELSATDLHTHKCNFSTPYYNVKVLCSICGDAISAFNITTHHIHCEREKAPQAAQNSDIIAEDESNNYIVVNDGNNIDYLFNSQDDDGGDYNNESVYRPKYSPVITRNWRATRPEHRIFVSSDDEDDGMDGPYEYECEKDKPYDPITKIKYSDDEDPYSEFYRRY